jgi:aspartate-semialdehyde dehydrogenase
VGILGATGVVGQRLVVMVARHPWFRLTALAASERSAGRRYGEVCPWRLALPMPEEAAGLEVQPLRPDLDCDLVLSSLPSGVAREAEAAFAAAGHVVVSNSSAYRAEPDVPLIIPEVNADHLAVLELQRRRRGWRGFIVTNPNCSAAGLTLALAPIQRAFGIRRALVVTMQAVSGAGYPGTASLDILDNVIPHIAGEEEKLEREPGKILGRWSPEEGFVPAPLRLSAMCHRVPVLDGHLEAVSLELDQAADPGAVAAVLAGFRPPEEIAGLPSCPELPIVVRESPFRPQPRLDRGLGGGMTVTVGPVTPCSVLQVKFRLLGHNTVRGAAGAALLNAELLVRRGLVAGKV